MKTEDPNENGAPLRALLKEWKPEASLPPRFQEQVWRRIERAESVPAPSVSLATVFANWISNILPKPALATAYVTVLLVVGASVGWSQARQETARVNGELRARYAQAVDPYQAAPQP
jgi:hypothetical protein